MMQTRKTNVNITCKLKFVSLENGDDQVDGVTVASNPQNISLITPCNVLCMYVSGLVLDYLEYKS